MTALVYPRDYAGDATFTSGVDTGQPTKVDPGAAVENQGLIPGVSVAAATLNHSLNSLSTASRYMAEQALFSLIPLGVPIGGYMSALEDAVLTVGCALAINGRNYVFLGQHPGAFEDRSGQLVALGARSMGAATDPISAAAVSFGGTDAWGVLGSTSGDIITVTTDEGASWTDIPAAPGVAWVAVQRSVSQVGGTVLVFSGAVGDVVSCDPPYTLAITRSLSAAFDLSSATATTGSTVMVLRSSGGVATGTDTSVNGVAYADPGGSFIDPDSIGYISSDGTDFFWVGTKTTSGDTTVQISTDDGVNWSEVTTIAHPFTTVTTDTSHVLACVPGTDIMWMAVKEDTTNDWHMYASVDSGLSWIGPRFIGTSIDGPSFSVAGGHLYVGFYGLPMLRTAWRLS